MDDEEADLGLVALVVPEGHAEDESVERDDVVFPNHAVHRVDALVHVAAARRLAELVNQKVAEGAEVGGDLLGSDPLQDLVGNGRDVVSLQDHLPEETEEETVALRRGEVLDDVVLVGHGAPRPPLLLHTLLQLGDVLLGDVGLAEHVHQDRGEVVEGVRGPGVRRVGHDGAHNLLQPGGAVL